MKDRTGIAKADWAEQVNVGAEGWKQDDSFLAFRTTKQTYVVVEASQSIVIAASQSIPVDTFARAIAPVLGG